MKKPFKILLCELPLTFRFPFNLAIAYLKLMVEKRMQKSEVEITIINRKQMCQLGDQSLIKTILDERPHLVGFSCYMWNIVRTLHIVRNIKKANPHIMTLLGGPEIAVDHPLISTVPEIDLMVLGEGEWTFLDLVRNLVEGRDLTSVEGLGHRIGAELIVNPQRMPGACLDEIPSPYLSGIIPISGSRDLHLEIARGCHYRCSYCFYSKHYPYVRYFSSERIREEIEFAREKGVRSIWLSDPCFNAKKSKFYEICELLSQVNRDKKIVFHTEIRAELIFDKEARLLDAANFRFVSAGLQSTNPVALKNVNRKVDLVRFTEGIRCLLTRDIKIQVDIMLGLPGDSLMNMMETTGFVENLSEKCAKAFSLTKVLPGTELRRDAQKFGITFQEEPPYCVLATKEISHKHLMRLARLESPPWLMKRKPSLTDSFSPLDSCFRPLNPGGKIPLRGLKLEIDTPNPRIENDLLGLISDHSTLHFSLWLDSRENRSPDASTWERLLKQLAEKLPFTFWDIVFSCDLMGREAVMDSFRRAFFGAKRCFPSDIAPCNLGISRLNFFYIMPIKDLQTILGNIAKPYRTDSWSNFLMQRGTEGETKIHQPSLSRETFLLKMNFPSDGDAWIPAFKRIPQGDHHFAILADFKNVQNIASTLEFMARLKKANAEVWFTDLILEGVWRMIDEKDATLMNIFQSLIGSMPTDSRTVVWPRNGNPMEISFSQECFDIAMDWALAIQKWKKNGHPSEEKNLSEEGEPSHSL
jgi:hypothetical protein